VSGGGVNYPLGASGTGNEHVPLAGIHHSLPLCYSTAPIISFRFP
jgi:hypothetical protein